MAGGSRSNAERRRATTPSARVAVEAFTTRELARLARLSPRRVRRCVHAGILHPARGPRRRFEFAMQDLLLLRATRGLLEAGVGPQRVAAVVRHLDRELDGRGVSSVKLLISDGHIVATDGRRTWQPGSNQFLLGFAPPAARARLRRLDRAEDTEDEAAAYRAFSRGLSLEGRAPDEAKAAYREVLRLDPRAVPALVNLGRLEHESGNHAEAERLYRDALAEEPGERTAAFNLALLAEDQGQPRVAIRRYEQALAAAPDLADAHHRLARLYASLGDQAAARRHTQRYRSLLRRR